ncbi:uncharacterized protein LOC125209811 [Salvia hispanica]|uniref:uncharacterized protein LOC125209811 n=1 Tax=Salvia hispanica TaxID=49212 RepID=UPI0020099C04|nr:uncharacterized protein LOC125209811 [Salvia hispanica]
MSSGDEFQQLVDREFDELVQEVQREAEEEEAAAAFVRPFYHRRTIWRDHVGAHQRLVEDYFGDNPRYPAEIFRRRFRMSQRLFIHIANTLAQRYRQFAYAGPADMFDEYLQLGETTALTALRQFCNCIQTIFGPEYLRKPNADECQRLIDMHGRVHNFPGMMGSIDCMHWEWRNCPVAWKEQFTSGFKGRHPTMILEVVADYRLRIWHAYFGVAGSNNDINVLDSSHLFNDECRGEGPTVRFMANGTQYNRAYYLADGIYPRWPVFVKTIRQPVGPKQSYFAAKQESARKDVERAFGVLQSRWGILRCPIRQWHENDVASIMYACIILHNMIIEDEGYSAENWAPEEGASTSHGVATAPLQMGVPRSDAYLIQRFANMRRETSHTTLQADMVEEVWNRRGGGRRA